MSDDPSPYTPDDLDSLRGMITLDGKGYVSLISDNTGLAYLQEDGTYNIPEGVDITKPFGTTTHSTLSLQNTH